MNFTWTGKMNDWAGVHKSLERVVLTATEPSRASVYEETEGNQYLNRP